MARIGVVVGTRPAPNRRTAQDVRTRPPSPPALQRDHASILELQKTVGNRAVLRLVNARGAAPGPAPLQRKLAMDGAEIASFAEFKKLAWFDEWLPRSGISEGQVKQVVDTMIAVLGFDYGWTAAEFQEKAPQVWAAYKDDTVPTVDPIRLKQLVNLMHQESVVGKLKVTGSGSAYKRLISLAGLSDSNVTALNKHMEGHPGLSELATKHGLQIKFNSPTAKGLRGMYTKGNKTAHVEGDVSTVRSDYFLRTLIHEMGHGTFQRELLKGELEEATNKGKVDSILMSEAEQGKFTDDGALFFKAWEVLRQNSADRMFGMSLGTDSTDEESRRNYQAATFTEFCAESFMHMAVEESALATFVINLARRKGTPREVLVAWRDVLRILQKYKLIINKRPD